MYMAYNSYLPNEHSDLAIYCIELHIAAKDTYIYNIKSE